MRRVETSRIVPSPAREADEELAAAIIAVDLVLAAEHARPAVPTSPPDREGWRNSARLAALRIAPIRAAPARWNTIERIRRS
jgi:hypothetical protein